MGRRKAREIAMKLLYQYDITGELSAQPLEEMPDVLDTETLKEENRAYLDNVIRAFPDKREEIDGIISEFSHSWKIERIGKVDLAILRLALFEILFVENIPEKVSVNEAVEMAKEYSTDKSHKYINGLLGGYLRSRKALQPEG
ncbi:MAG: transcription antitermination factor NusB [Christensenellaceae bacterium]|jgi:N utilization substance protein B